MGWATTSAMPGQFFLVDWLFENKCVDLRMDFQRSIEQVLDDTLCGQCQGYHPAGWAFNSAGSVRQSKAFAGWGITADKINTRCWLHWDVAGAEEPWVHAICAPFLVVCPRQRPAVEGDCCGLVNEHRAHVRGIAPRQICARSGL